LHIISYIRGMNIDLSKAGLARYHNKAEIIEKTALQVIKDFALFGIQIDFPDNLNYAYEELYRQLNTQVEELLALNSSKLLSILYQIDIPEKKIRKEADENSERELPEIITELILDRELKKVLTRIYFSNLNS